MQPPPDLDAIDALQPEYVICNHQKIPTNVTEMPFSNMQWGFYEVTNIATANRLLACGATLIETMDPGKLLKEWQRADAHQQSL